MYMYMGAHVELGMLENALLHQLPLLVLGHTPLLEVEGHIGFLYHNWSVDPVLTLEHTAENLTVAVVFAALHFNNKIIIF